LHEYESRENAESRFVYLIEKLEPILLVLSSVPDHWIKRGISFKMFFEKKQEKIKDLKTVAQFLNKDLMKYLEKSKKLWSNKK